MLMKLMILSEAAEVSFLEANVKISSILFLTFFDIFYSMNHLVCNIRNSCNFNCMIDEKPKKILELSADFYSLKGDLLKNVLVPSSNATNLTVEFVMLNK